MHLIRRACRHLAALIAAVVGGMAGLIVFAAIGTVALAIFAFFLSRLVFALPLVIWRAAKATD